MKPMEGLEDHTKLGAVAAELRRRGMSERTSSSYRVGTSSAS